MSELQDIVKALRRAEEWVNVPMQASDAAGLRDELRNSADALSRLAQQAPVAWWNKKYGTFHTHDESDAEQSEAAKAGEIVPLCSCLVVAQAPVQAEPVALKEFADWFSERNVEATGDWRAAVEDTEHKLADLLASPVVAQGWQATTTNRVFDETALLYEVERVWGKYGTHAEVLRNLIEMAKPEPPPADTGEKP